MLRKILMTFRSSHCSVADRYGQLCDFISLKHVVEFSLATFIYLTAAIMAVVTIVLLMCSLVAHRWIMRLHQLQS